MKNSRLLSICGLLAAVVYLLAVLIASAQFPGYSHASEYISNLGANGQPSAMTMNAGFILVGLLVILFAVSTFLGFKRSWASLVGGLFLVGVGLSEVMAGFFQCDPGCNAVNPSMAETIHNSAGPLGYLLFFLAAIFWALRFRKQNAWELLWVYSLITGIGAFVLFGLFGMSVGTPVVGIWQRLLTASEYLWLAIFSYRLWSMWEERPFALDLSVTRETQSPDVLVEPS